MAGALVHEWVESTGGAEKVLTELARTADVSDLYCLWNDAGENFPEMEIHESWLARTRLRKHKALAVPAFPLAWRGMVSEKHEWALISSHLFAHHVTSGPGAELRKFVYAHTPARYLWEPDLDPRGQGIAVKLAAPLLKALDRKRAQEPVSIAANSLFVADRIRKAWDREARVIYPPVNVDRIASVADWSSTLEPEDLIVIAALPSDFLLAAGRLVEYKRFDLAIRAAHKLNMPIVIAGKGPQEQRLRCLAVELNSKAIFVGKVSDELLYTLYQQARAYLFLGIEDFGIMPVEAMAAGCPVVAGVVGGASESVIDGTTGALVASADSRSLAGAVNRALQCSAASCVERAYHFDVKLFETRISDWIEPSRMRKSSNAAASKANGGRNDQS